MWRARGAAIAAGAAGLAAAGCGGGDDGGGGKPTQPTAGAGAASKLALSADPSGKLAFDKKSLQATAGRVTIVMGNPSPLSHNVSLEGSGIDKEGRPSRRDRPPPSRRP